MDCWPCAAYLRQQPRHRRRGIVRCRLALEGFPSAWCTSCRASSGACDRRLSLLEWPAQWQLLVRTNAIPDPSSSDASVLSRLRNEVVSPLLETYKRRASAQSKSSSNRRRPYTTLWRAAEAHWVIWMQVATSPVAAPFFGLPSEQLLTLCLKWARAASILEHQRSAVVQQLVQHLTGGLASTDPPPLPPLSALLLAVQRRQGASDDCWGALERELYVQIGRLSFKRVRLDIAHGNSSQPESCDDATDDEPAAAVQLGGRLAKGRARMQIFDDAKPKRAKRTRSVKYFVAQLQQHGALRLAELLSSNIESGGAEPDLVTEIFDAYVQFQESVSKAEACLIGAGQWLFQLGVDTTASDAVDTPVRQQQMRRLREESRLLVDFGKELRAYLTDNLPDTAQEELARIFA